MNMSQEIIDRVERISTIENQPLIAANFDYTNEKRRKKRTVDIPSVTPINPTDNIIPPVPNITNGNIKRDISGNRYDDRDHDDEPSSQVTTPTNKKMKFQIEPVAIY